jgi:prepilin-type processing-associated H-X9-DG protein
MQAYHQANGSFPYGTNRVHPAGSESDKPTDMSARKTLYVALWPHIELTTLYDQYNQATSFFWSPNCIPNKLDGVVARPQPMYYCPSDRPGAIAKLDMYWRCRGNYVPNYGPFSLYTPGKPTAPFGWSGSATGWFWASCIPYQRSVASFTDGTSQTLLMSELRFPPADKTIDIRGDVFNDEGSPWFMTIATPNSGIDYGIRCDATADPTMPCGLDNASTGQQIVARSRRVGGVNAGMADGSVRFVDDLISLAVWQALSTINGGEVIGDF